MPMSNDEDEDYDMEIELEDEDEAEDEDVLPRVGAVSDGSAQDQLRDRCAFWRHLSPPCFSSRDSRLLSLSCSIPISVSIVEASHPTPAYERLPPEAEDRQK